MKLIIIIVLFFIPFLLLMIAFLVKTPVQADNLSNPKITSSGAVIWDLVSFGSWYQSGSTAKGIMISFKKILLKKGMKKTMTSR